MRVSRCLYLATLLFGLCGMAKADPLDFKMTVLDGPDPYTSLNGAIITSTAPFNVTFGECPTQAFPILVGASGCFELINNTGGTITSLDLSFMNSVGPNDIDSLNGQMPDCASSQFFDNVNSPCGFTGDPSGTGTYTLDFTAFAGGSGIPPTGANALVFLAIYGANPDAFGTTGSGTVTYTPEPSSVLLLGTGVLMMCGAFFVNRRRGFIG